MTLGVLVFMALVVNVHVPRAVANHLDDIAGLQRDRRQLRTAINIISVSVVGAPGGQTIMTSPLRDLLLLISPSMDHPPLCHGLMRMPLE